MAGSRNRSIGRLALVALSVSATAGTPIQVGHSSIPFRIVAEGSDSRIDMHRELIIRGIGIWDFVWRKHADSTPPAIDFRGESIIAIFAGRHTAATALQITTVGEEDGSIVVRYREDTRQPATPAGASSASPFAIVAIPPQRLPVKFVKVAE